MTSLKALASKTDYDSSDNSGDSPFTGATTANRSPSGGPMRSKMNDDAGVGLFSPSKKGLDDSKQIPEEDMSQSQAQSALRQDSAWKLPLEERSIQVPDMVIASVAFAKDNDHKDIIQVGHNTFRGQGGRLPVDEDHRVRDNTEVIEAMNSHTYGVRDGNASLLGCIGRIGSCGLYWCFKRRIIPDGYWGHYMSAGRHMLTPSGLQMLWNPLETWCNDIIKIDDEEHLVRTLGGKIIVTVPENHLGGAFKVTAATNVRLEKEKSKKKANLVGKLWDLKGKKGKKGKKSGIDEIELAKEEENLAAKANLMGKTDVSGDGDFRFVLFRSGRHVLDDADFRDVTVVKLGSKPILRFGPLTILYVKEGQLGGAYSKHGGNYRLFAPGPPHILHEQDYDHIELVQHRIEPFRLGPLTFLTVSEGQLAGAYETATGRFQLLPPSCVYQLHAKDFANIQFQERSALFRLGPFWFLTVRQGQLAGAFRKKGGQFQIFPPGFSFQLSDEEFEKPEVVEKNSHVVRCGPITFLTCATGTLCGAYRIKDGQFVQFNKPNQEYILHDRDYHSLVTIPRYSTEVQNFGPFKVFTVSEGELGAVVDDGKIRIKSPGTYIIPKDTKLLPPISMKTFTIHLEEAFAGKDTVEMVISATVTYKVEAPDLIVLFPGGFKGAEEDMKQMARSTLTRLACTHTREDLLPTQHSKMLDSLLIKPQHKDATFDDDELNQRSAREVDIILQHIESKLTTIMKQTSASSHWGFNLSCRVWGVTLKDERIKKELQDIAKTVMDTESQAANARLELAKFNAGKEVRICQTLWRRDGLLLDAKAEAAAAQVRAESLRHTLEQEMSITKEMTENQLKLKQAELALKAMAEMGKAAWRCPDNMQQFFATFSRYLSVGRGGPMVGNLYSDLANQTYPMLPPASAGVSE